MLRTFFILGFLGAALFSCYRMPTEDEVSVCPLTNNPALTREGNSSSMTPTMGY